MNPVSVTSCLLACLTLSSAAWADAQRLRVVAPVVSVSPIVRTVTDRIPHESCFDERVRVETRRGPHSPAPQVLGAVIGGVVGSVLGDNTGHQRAAATMGAVLGTVAGHDAAQRQTSSYRYVTQTRCETDYELRDREVVKGYRVGYEYGGEVYYTRTSHRPGRTIQLGVILEPVTQY